MCMVLQLMLHSTRNSQPLARGEKKPHQLRIPTREQSPTHQINVAAHSSINGEQGSTSNL